MNEPNLQTMHATRIEPYRPDAPDIIIPANEFEASTTIRQWVEFEPKSNLNLLFLRRLKKFVFDARPFPPYELLRLDNRDAKKWAVYFCFAPAGKPDPSHIFTIDRLKAEGFSVLVVCATERRADASAFDALNVDGVLWKGLRGYDFSGYTVGLEAIAKHCGEADVLVMNDSIIGPFHNISNLFKSSPWSLTGMINSYIMENHIISFCFYIKGFNSNYLASMNTVFSRNFSFDSQGPVSLLQETRLARVAHRVGSVGSVLSPKLSFKKRVLLVW